MILTNIGYGLSGLLGLGINAGSRRVPLYLIRPDVLPCGQGSPARPTRQSTRHILSALGV